MTLRARFFAALIAVASAGAAGFLTATPVAAAAIIVPHGRPRDSIIVEEFERVGPRSVGVAQRVPVVAHEQRWIIGPMTAILILRWVE